MNGHLNIKLSSRGIKIELGLPFCIHQEKLFQEFCSGDRCIHRKGIASDLSLVNSDENLCFRRFVSVYADLAAALLKELFLS